MAIYRPRSIHGVRGSFLTKGIYEDASIFGSPTGEWTPADPTSSGYLPHVWYDANQIVGLSDLDPVATWPDSGPNGDDLAQGVALDRPVYRTGIRNGMPAVQFNGANHYIFDAVWANAGALTQPYYVFSVGQLAAGAVDDGVIHHMFAGTSLANEMQLRTFTVAVPDTWGLRCGATLDAGDSNSNWNMWTGLVNGVTSDIRINGVGIAAGNAGAEVTAGIYVGAQSTGIQLWEGYVCEILIYDADIGVAARGQVESYLASKYAI